MFFIVDSFDQFEFCDFFQKKYCFVKQKLAAMPGGC
jgi:hypothetical protein